MYTSDASFYDSRQWRRLVNATHEIVKAAPKDGVTLRQLKTALHAQAQTDTERREIELYILDAIRSLESQSLVKDIGHALYRRLVADNPESVVAVSARTRSQISITPRDRTRPDLGITK